MLYRKLSTGGWLHDGKYTDENFYVIQVGYEGEDIAEKIHNHR